jgi:curved DNA-binding protein CbpA
MKTAYDVLGVPRNASNERIRTAFRNAAKACHPDLNAGDATAELQIRQVITAYEILKFPHRRAAYDHHLRERRGERARHFAMAAVANLLRGSIVALAVSLSASQSNTHDASAAPRSQTLSATARPDESLRVAVAGNPSRQDANKGPKSDWGAARPQTASSLPPTAGPPELYAALAREWGLKANGLPMPAAGPGDKAARSERIVLTKAAPPLSPKSLKKPSLEERATISESGSVLARHRQEDGRDHSRVIQITAHQHRSNRRTTSDESQSHDQRRAGSNSKVSTGRQHLFALSRGPGDLLALLVSPKMTPRMSSATRSNLVGAGGRAGFHRTRQIAVSSRAEAASENAHQVYRNGKNSIAKTIGRTKPINKITS